MEYPCEARKGDFHVRKLLITYPVYFDSEKYAIWFREKVDIPKGRDTKYLRILPLYSSAVYVLVWFTKKFKSNSNRLTYQGTVPEVRVIQNEDWMGCIQKLDKMVSLTLLPSVTVFNNTQACTTVMEKAICTTELESRFFTFLHELSPWQFLHVKLEESYHDLYHTCIRFPLGTWSTYLLSANKRQGIMCRQ